MEKNCVFCGSREIKGAETEKRLYYRCQDCGGIFLDPVCRMEPKDEKKRYELHNNSLENEGYRLYLEKFWNSVCSFPAVRSAGFSKKWTVFDYGSGPEPSLVRLLQAQGIDARGRDPFFAPNTPCFENGADLVTCLEVAEHFAEPVRDFLLLGECLRSGGFLAVGTHLLDCLQDERSFPNAVSGGLPSSFAAWWYRQDPTHISFYTETSLRLVGEKACLEWLGPAGPQVYMFRKGAAK